MGGLAALVFVMTATAMAGAESRYDAAAIELNNRGVALMGQQFTERAEQSFSAAFKKEPTLAQAAINDGIALMTLQKLPEAEKALKAALALDPGNPQAWYNLGLVQHSNTIRATWIRTTLRAFVTRRCASSIGQSQC
jgi:Flp pilus assembly protein TadD